MKNIFLTLFLTTSMLAACSLSPSSPVPTALPQSGDYAPKPQDSSFIQDPVYLDSTDLLTMESFPLQFSLILQGSLPSPCHQLRIASNGPDSENKIHLDVYSVIDSTITCEQVLEPFNANYPMGSYPQGHYLLFVNGKQIAEFDS